MSNKKTTCSIPGCEKLVQGRGWCGTHLQRWNRHGDPLAVLNNRGMEIEHRFLIKVHKTDSCWLWTSSITRDGYGLFGAKPQYVLAHRWSYEHFVGPIPEGLQIDHLCRVRHCVNPDHLEPVTPGENTRRAAASRTHCSRGHLYTEDNTHTDSRGWRTCLLCVNVGGRRKVLS